MKKKINIEKIFNDYLENTDLNAAPEIDLAAVSAVLDKRLMMSTATTEDLADYEYAARRAGSYAGFIAAYTIDILVGTAKYDFSDSPIAAYILKDKHGKFPTAELNEEDLPEIIAGLHEAAAYECFKAINKRGHENGNS